MKSIDWVSWILGTAALAGCTSSPKTAKIQSPMAEEEVLQFEGTVVMPEPVEAMGKKFFGVFVQRDGGEQWVVDYHRGSPFHQFVGRRVRLSGKIYEPAPEAQALQMTHFQVRTLTAIDPSPELHVVEVGAEERILGRFQIETFEPGSKLAGESIMRFVSDAGASYLLANMVDSLKVGPPYAVTARTVEMSPFITRLGGRYLWIRRVEATP